jgi:predicted nucleotide-binding protein
MARKPIVPQSKEPAKLSPQQMTAGIERLKKRLVAVEQFEPQSVTDQYSHPELDALSASIDEAFVRTFGADTLDYERYKPAIEFDCGPYSYMETVRPDQFQATIAKSKARSYALIRQAINALEEQFTEHASTASVSLVSPGTASSDSRRIFVVHGHDDAARETVARFIDQLGFAPIILHEQPNKGRTIITKFREEAAEVGFAVVLMTPDDHGAMVNVETKPRARQNVVFELGFFIGALGPERVVALVKGDVERPSDFDGVVYISLDQGHWKIDLAKELKAAGYKVDFNKVIG